MNKWIKRAGVTIGTLGFLAVATVMTGKYLGERKLQRIVTVSVAPVALTTDAVQIEQGRYLFTTRGCAECHGGNGGGTEMIRDGDFMVNAPNITAGPNSVVKNYQAVDWVRAIRHGVKPNGKPAFIMPSEDYNRLTDQDLGALISYVLSLPPAEGKGSLVQLPTPLAVLYGFGGIQDAFEKIDHTLPPSQPIPAAITVAHGAYVANSCIGCHGAKLSGGKIPGTPPDWPPASNLTPGKDGVMGRYPTPEVFMAMLRSGHRPDGSAVSKVMPFPALAAMNETDVFALHAYLKTTPPRDAGNR